MYVDTFDEPDLIDDLTEDGFEDREHAERALRSTLAAIASCLTADGAVRLARALPPELRDGLRASAAGRRPRAEQILARVHAREPVSSGRAREEIQIVLRALGRRLDDADRDAIAGMLPEEIAHDLDPAPRGIAPPAPAPPPHGHSLSTGRPGSSHPLAEAAPTTAHGESVARAVEPHRETKLSTARGLTQERERETLAEGQGGSSRPLAGRS